MIIVYHYGGNDFNSFEINSKEEAIKSIIDCAQEYIYDCDDPQYLEDLKQLILSLDYKAIRNYLYRNLGVNVYTTPKDIFK